MNPQDHMQSKDVFQINQQILLSKANTLIYKDLRDQLENSLLRINKDLPDEIYSQAWSPCLTEIKLDLLSYRSEITDEIAKVLFGHIKSQRSSEGFYGYFLGRSYKI